VDASYGLPGPELAVDLVNSYDRTLAQPEHLRTPADLDALVRSHGLVLDPASADDLVAVRAVRDELRAPFETSGARRAEALNELLASTPLRPVLCAEGARTVLRLVVADSVPVAVQVRAAAALAVAEAAARLGLERLAVCADEPCRDVFFDRSPNRSRRHCSDRCSNRSNVAAYRRRRRK
jgi:predicted RNA-binding Zn ribbon-like protein